MTIAAILNDKGSECFTIAGDAQVADAIRLLTDRRIGAAPVLDGDQVVGIFSERDVMKCLASIGAQALSRHVSDLMTAPAVTVSPRESVLAALALMTQRRIRHLPVIDDGALVGLVSIGDLVKYRIERIESEASAMRAYIQQA